jgi:Leucine-rich repeat (LRR) protein
MKKIYSNPFLLLLLSFITGTCFNSYAQFADENDSLILVDFQKAMMQKGWPQFWDTSQNVSNWAGVTKNGQTGKIIQIDIWEEDLSVSFKTDSLPSCISSLQHLDSLTGLGFHQFGLKYLPENISDFEKLELLSFGYNEFTEIPSSLGKLKNLQSLFIGDNQLTDLPDDLSSLTNLTYLILSSNKTLTKFPNVVTKLTALTKLDIGYTSITNLPEDIKNLRNLNKIRASSCDLIILPNEIGELPALVTLYLNNNELSKLPESMGNLQNLKYLQVNMNNLTELPDSVSNLDSLKSIQFYSNQLDSFPACLAKLPKLQYINGENNNMKGNVPPDIFEKKNLHLYLDNNNLSGKLEIQSNNTPTHLHVKNNRFTLKDIIEHYNDFDPDYNPYGTSTFIKFQPQQNIGSFRTLKPIAGDDIGLGVDNYEPAEGCEITWYKTDRLNETGTAVTTVADDTLNIEDFDPEADAGVYYCVVTHPDLEDLSLTSNSICLVGDVDVAPNITASDVLFRYGNDAMLYMTISDDYTSIKDMCFDFPDTTKHFILRPDSVTNYPNNRYIFPKKGVLAAVDTVKISVTDGGGNTSSTNAIIKMVPTENQPPQINMPLIYMNIVNQAELSCIPEKSTCNKSYIFATETSLDNYVTDDYTSSGKLTFNAVIDSIDGVNSDSITYIGTNAMQVMVWAKSDVTVYVSLTASDDEGGTTTKQVQLKGIGISQSAKDPNDPPVIASIPEQVIEKGTTAFPPLNLRDYITDDYLPFEELDITLSPNSITAKIQKDSMLYVSPLYKDSIYSGSLTLTVKEKRNSLNENIADINYRIIDRNLSVLFDVTASGLPVKDALITINGSNYITDGMGHATVSLPSAGSYSYTVSDVYVDSDTEYQDASGTVTITNSGLTENVILIPEIPTAINDESQETASPCIYPNPVSNRLNIDMPAGIEVDVIEVYNIEGSKVFAMNTKGQSSVQIDMGGYSEGVYFIRGLQKGKVVFSGKVIRSLP